MENGVVFSRTSVAVAIGATVTLVAWPAFTRMSVAGMHPHGYCYLWDPSLVTLHVTADALIGLS
jgi:hypothetical protein